MPVLVDTAVWVQHLNNVEPELYRLLLAGEVVGHSVVVGELAAGNLPKRSKTLCDLRALQRVPDLTTDECLDFLELHSLGGLGLSWGDIQILAAAVTQMIPIWTFDQRLRRQAQALGVEWVL